MWLSLIIGMRAANQAWEKTFSAVSKLPSEASSVKLGVPLENRPWWRQIWEKLLSPIPNCNAVAQSP